MEKIKIEEKNFTFKKIKFEDEFENNLNKGFYL